MDAILKTQAEKFAREMAAQARTVDDLNGLMRAMMKPALERILNTERDVHLGQRADPAVADATRLLDEVQSPAKNRRNGHSRKTFSGDLGDVPLQTPRDRNGSFEPKAIAKHQHRPAGFDEKIMALYANGMTKGAFG